MNDDVTFFAAFAAIALLLGAFLWHLERRGTALEERVRTIEADEIRETTGQR